MQAVILAAGRGNRMRPLTDEYHKTLLTINGAPLIDRLITDLGALGIQHILVVTGYRTEEVEAHLQRRFAHLDLRFVRNEQYETTNNIVSLALAFEQLNLYEDLLLIEADLICDRSLIRRLIESPMTDAALLDRYRSGMDGTVVTVSDGVITSVIPSHLQGAEFDFSDKYKTLNIYKFSAELCRSAFAQLLRYYAQSVDGTVYYELILGILIYLRQARIHAVLVEPSERWAEIDDPNDLAVARFTFHAQQRRTILEESLGGWWAHEVLDFCFLRNMYWPTAAMLSELRRDLPQLVQNYGSTQAVLDRKLQWWLLCSEGRATVLAGSSQVFPWLSQKLAGKRVLLPAPTFGEYPRVFPQHEIYNDCFAIDLAEIERKLPATDVCVIVTPNNPTGTVIANDVLHGLIARHPQTLFLVDESFQGFSDQPSLIALLEQEPLPNVLILVSLSKTLGVPGARLGYVYTCDPAWRDELRSSLPIWNLSSVAERVLELGLKHRQALETGLRETRRDRLNFANELRCVPAVERIQEGGGNFLLVAFRRAFLPPEGLVEYLLAKHRIITKDVSVRIGDGQMWLRIAVRLPHENRLFIAALNALPQRLVLAKHFD